VCQCAKSAKFLTVASESNLLSARPGQDDSLCHLAAQDPDNTVREAAGDALGQIAEHLYGQHSVYSAGTQEGSATGWSIRVVKGRLNSIVYV